MHPFLPPSVAGGPLSPDRRRGVNNRDQREWAKAGMAASMGMLVFTGFLEGDAARKWHIASGVALIGFSWWHHSLYQRRESS
ncbi:hypothetical protein DPQ33_11060 [Oceanidesulfovibrio indonesiensis]|uniref:Uncharacterized protein n=1 Tax=Oceanidesulfovibrio indonesiensis TaxID=54767 RepID=A0A7M3MF13_9BACT|nr:hypothetical protein [Oceanidesulfovibrio indonesiensis]TVM16934.1 hypothetical protein DPQ33_11060 [Oceanidesulfovibrio indonesiensis]